MLLFVKWLEPGQCHFVLTHGCVYPMHLTIQKKIFLHLSYLKRPRRSSVSAALFSGISPLLQRGRG